MRRRPARWQTLLRYGRTKPLGTVGFALITIMILLAILSPFIAPYDPYKIHVEHMFSPPNTKFLLGTDSYGRDMLSRIIWGSRISLYVGVLSVAIGSAAGGLLGLVSGYFGGRTDLITQRFVDIMMAFPSLILAMCVVAALGTGLSKVTIAIALTLVAQSCRIVRSAVLSVKETQYMDAARAIGCSHQRTLFLHALPNCLAPYIIIATAMLARAIIAEASLSFLGLGVPPPEPSWGGMLSGAAQEFVQRAPWMAIFPGMAISLAVFGFNLLGDAVRDVWDPRLRGR